ncbi:MAG: hypothetical protein ACXWCG_05130 [Flavitalea sp.]
MLTDEQKTKIALEEQYRNEVALSFKTKSKIDLIETVIKILQGLAIIAGIWATYYAYKKQNDENRNQEIQQRQQTAKEFRKTFYEKQLQFYTEATDATATLATEDIGTEEYKKAKKDFLRLFWGRLSIVEDRTVEARMVDFNKLLEGYEQPGTDITKDDLEQASLKLAHAASSYTINVWLDSTERKNYNR